ncbi:hypothetical protein NE237_024492 [Protea cynaroides]|uniref:Integrase catalytic domain-containing protein n=1 Tax=Protea cynaroides TaxID=273540 RepID=A0A9Q0H004_9MAGN|nr:hypothetical protein NE237_024492 [Protea cynaroides]
MIVISSIIRGKANVVADALSRKAMIKSQGEVSTTAAMCTTGTVFNHGNEQYVIDTTDGSANQGFIHQFSNMFVALKIIPDIIDEVKTAIKSDPYLRTVQEDIEKDRTNPEFTLDEEKVLKYKGRICVPETESVDIRHRLMKEAHTTIYSIHPGRLPLTPRVVDTVWVIVDRLTKTARFISIRPQYTLERLAKLYVDNIVRLHGVPESIVSDRDPRFTSKFWEGLQKAMGTTLRFSTTFHPQTDGQSERTIQILEDMLRACVIDFKGSWDEKLPLIEFAYNNSYQATIQMSPYEALYGRKCQTPLFWNEVGECSIVGPEFVEETCRVVDIIKEIMRTTQNHQKQYADTRRRDLEFVVDDKKYVKDPTHVLIVDLPDLTDDLTFEVTPTEITSGKVQRLCNRDIYYVKVTWRSRDMEEITWEEENAMRKQYPHLFDSEGMNNFGDEIFISRGEL